MVKIYTRTGDRGSTALADGTRVSKAAVRVAAYGDVDELNASLGVLRAEALCEADDVQVLRIQSALFEVGAFLADPAGRFTPGDDVVDPSWLEAWIDRMEGELEPLHTFILPAGVRGAALAHAARTVCRRAERSVVALGADAPELSESIVPFLNRLSDSLFVLARRMNVLAGRADVPWQGRHR